ncbi:hypothetical protein O3P69_004668 [Scylla paramamosain]|uniref:Uncharacterized protein n=1 Tax=Scylla paramamosain TaxID=85552 RepID=A0AAW0UCQ9_SCYPA
MLVHPSVRNCHPSSPGKPLLPGQLTCLITVILPWWLNPVSGFPNLAYPENLSCQDGSLAAMNHPGKRGFSAATVEFREEKNYCTHWFSPRGVMMLDVDEWNSTETKRSLTLLSDHRKRTRTATPSSACSRSPPPPSQDLEYQPARQDRPYGRQREKPSRENKRKPIAGTLHPTPPSSPDTKLRSAALAARPWLHLWVGPNGNKRQRGCIERELLIVSANVRGFYTNFSNAVVLLVSEDPDFLTAFAHWLLKSRPLVWKTRLLVLTRIQLTQVQPLHQALSHTNSMLVTPTPTKLGIRVRVDTVVPYSKPLDKQSLAAWTYNKGLRFTSHLHLFPDKFQNAKAQIQQKLAMNISKAKARLFGPVHNMDRIESLIDMEENEEYGGVRWENPEQGESEVNANQAMIDTMKFMVAKLENMSMRIDGLEDSLSRAVPPEGGGTPAVLSNSQLQVQTSLPSHSMPLAPVMTSTPAKSTSEVRVKPSDIKILELDELQRLNSAARLQMFFESVERCASNSDARLEVAKSRVDGDLAVMIHTAQRQGEVKVWEDCKTYLTKEFGVDLNFDQAWRQSAQPEAEQIRTRNDRYASFLVQVDKSVEERVLDQDEWEEGLIVRPFRGFLRRNTHDPAVINTTRGSTGAYGMAAAAQRAVPLTLGDADAATGEERRDSSDDVISGERYGKDAERMRSARAEFNFALRQCRRNEEVLRAEAMSRNLASEDSRALWRCVSGSGGVRRGEA